MPKSQTSDLIGVSIRVTDQQLEWAGREAKKLGSFNTVVRELLDDARTWFSLPEVLRSQLEAEAKRLGKSRREYFIHVLTLHAVALLNEATGKVDKKR